MAELMEYEYKIRCDKHNFKPYEYCEMCMLRSEVQACVEKNREMIKNEMSSTALCISVIHDSLDKMNKQIDDLYYRLLGEKN